MEARAVDCSDDRAAKQWRTLAISLITVVGVLVGNVGAAGAQWLNHRDERIPRTRDDKPDLTAPAPRTSEGTQDLSGIWKIADSRYVLDLAADGLELPFQAAARALYQQRLDNLRRD